MIKASGDLAELTEIKVDGAALDTANYTVGSGSTVLMLKSAYLDTLAETTHNVASVYRDGAVSTTLTAQTADNGGSTSNNTGGGTASLGGAP